jgi:hypothetical protein
MNGPQAIAVLAEYFRVELTPAAARMWAEDLGSMTSEELERAIAKIRGNTDFDFMPTPGRIIEAAQADQMGADAAWAEVVQRISRQGRMATTKDWSPRIQAAVAACGGYPTMCSSERPDNDRFTFRRAYNESKSPTQRALESGP